jgi:FtsZ-binding cell division protein ZapB
MTTTPKPTLDERKYKEWWAVFEFAGYSFYKNKKDATSAAKKSKEDVIHVIEYAAIAEMQVEIERLREEVRMCMSNETSATKYGHARDQHNLILQEENKKLREALEYIISYVDYEEGGTEFCKHITEIARKALEAK